MHGLYKRREETGEETVEGNGWSVLLDVPVIEVYASNKHPTKAREGRYGDGAGAGDDLCFYRRELKEVFFFFGSQVGK